MLRPNNDHVFDLKIKHSSSAGDLWLFFLIVSFLLATVVHTATASQTQLQLVLVPSITTEEILQGVATIPSFPLSSQRNVFHHRRQGGVSTPCTSIVHTIRGGAYFLTPDPSKPDSPMELNPDYVDYAQPNQNGHQLWLQQQQQQQQQKSNPKNYYYRSANADLYSGMKQSPSESLSPFSPNDYLVRLYQNSPLTFWTATSCIVTFISWQIPFMRPFLRNYFVSNRSNFLSTKGISLLLAAVSHVSIRHVLVNLISLLHLGPALQRELAEKETIFQLQQGRKAALWPLFLLSVTVGNGLFLFVSRPNASCIGLSGVTMSLVALEAQLNPERIFGFVLMGIVPIRIPAKRLFEFLLLLSIAGTCFASGRNSHVAHATHLGGLVVGVLYHAYYFRNIFRQKATLSSSSPPSSLKGKKKKKHNIWQRGAT